MVGFWLAGTQTGLSAWALWASSYLAIVLVEPVLTYAVVRTLKVYEGRSWARVLDLGRLRLAA